MKPVKAVAHSNIALAKYWGKRPGPGNIPAMPSLSVTLAGMTTTTEVSFDASLAKDEVSINGALVDTKKMVPLFEEIRRESGKKEFVRATSTNDFPTASGLASSASGFAALTLGTVRAAGLDWSLTKIADLARRGSGSAARSLLGGFVALEGTEVRQVLKPNELDLRVLVAVTTEAQKAASSGEGMKLTQENSPYYAAWLDTSSSIFGRLEAALLAKDFLEVGKLAEQSALAMHACMLAAGVVYVSGATLSALAEVRAMRADGMQAFATIDAGPHLKCLVRSADVAMAKFRLASVPGVLRVLETEPGEGARVIA